MVAVVGWGGLDAGDRMGVWGGAGADPVVAAAQRGGMPLFQALRERQTIREISSQPLPEQVLSELLWAAFGVNRPEIGKRTAASAYNAQEVDVYVATAQGLYRYVAQGHRLEPILGEDIRRQTGDNGFGAEAPVVLVFVGDLARLEKALPDRKVEYAAADTGSISQNVYLYCASEKLATVVHDLTDREGLARRMQLRPGQKIILAQSVGYPMKRAEK